MKKYQFKTNINCSGCVEKVTPFLNKADVTRWEVDTSNPQKILTVETDTLSRDELEGLVKSAGFKIEKIK
jgi:copper chaperone